MTHIESNRGHNQRKTEGFSTAGKGYDLRRRAPKRSKDAFGGIPGPQSGRRLPLVGPPRGGTARSSQIGKFSGPARKTTAPIDPPQGRRLEPWVGAPTAARLRAGNAAR